MKTVRVLSRNLLQTKQSLQQLNENVKHTYTTEAKFQTKPFQLHHLTQGPATESTLAKTEALKVFTDMVAIRKMEAKINTLYKAKEVRGFCHLYSGQEAVALGVSSILLPQDSVITSYRCHPWAYLYHTENPLEKVIAELMGKITGTSRGKGGSMHMYAPQFYGGNAIVGSQVPIGTGVAFANMYQKKNGVCVVLHGDGSVNNGQVLETYNMAMLWRVPCIFLCENNIYSMGTSVSRSSANTKIYTKGDIVPGIQADGMDFFSMKEAMKFARDHCVSGKGPIMLEAQTYRYFGHSLSDPGTSYRTREEIDSVRKARDPITHYKKQILGSALVTEDELNQIDAQIKKAVDNATKAARAAKEPPLEELTRDVYANPLEKNIRLTDSFKTGVHTTSGIALNLK